MAVQTFDVRCLVARHTKAVDVKSTFWVALMPKEADAELPNRGFDEWYDSGAARCRRCGWEGKTRDVLIEKIRPVYHDRQNTASAPSFWCPAGHTEGLQESHEVHVWFPLNATTCQANYAVLVSELEASDIDEDSVSDYIFYCPTCNEHLH